MNLVRVWRNQKNRRPGGGQRSDDDPRICTLLKPDDAVDDCIEARSQGLIHQPGPFEFEQAECKILLRYAFGQNQ
ncbi:hypothetical protein D3C72_2228600 [compost metagenome]